MSPNASRLAPPPGLTASSPPLGAKPAATATGALHIGRPGQVRGFYDREWTAAAEDADFSSGLAVFRQIGIPESALAGKRVLDAGCGTGMHAVVMAKHFDSRITAVDIEPACVELARRLARSWQVDVDARLDDLTRLSGPREVFDAVVSIGVVHHTGDAAGCLRSFFDALKPGGRCFVSVIRRSPLVVIQRLAHGIYQHAPRPAKRLIYAVALSGAWMATRLSRRGRQRFTALRVGVRDALACPYHQVQRDREWLALIRQAGFIDVARVRAWNLWGHQGLYCGRKPLSRGPEPA